MEFSYLRRQSFQCFAISKDTNVAGHVGFAAGPHHWNVEASAVCAVVEWELEHDSDFEVLAADGSKVQLQQATPRQPR